MPSLELLSYTAAGRMLGVHRKTIARWVRQDILTAVVAGPGVAPRVRRADIDRLLNPTGVPS